MNVLLKPEFDDDGPNWSTSCTDWEQRIISGSSLIPFEPLFPDQAEGALQVFKRLRLVDVAGSPTIGEACRDWVFDICRALFGGYDGEAGRRLISEFFLLVSKKNSKSTLAAGLMLTALIRNWRYSGEFLILAPTIEVAKNSFGPASDMVYADDELRRMLHVQVNTRIITHKPMNATLKVVAADDDAVSGKKAIGVLVDELWLFGKRPNAENMLREATGGRASRPEGFVIYLSTQSDDPPAGVFKSKLSYARAVRDGTIINKRFLPIIYEFPKEIIKNKEYLNIENFFMTNPNLGLSVDPEYLREEHEKAEIGGPESMRGFMSKHLNIEVGLSMRSDRWAGADFWEAAANYDITLEWIMEHCEVITAGIDGGGLDDLLSLSFIGREKITRKWYHWQHSWVHKIIMEKREKEGARIKDFEAEGTLTIVDDMSLAFEQLAGYIEKVHKARLLSNIGLDPAGVGLIVEAIAEKKIPTESPFMVGVSQGYQLQGAIKTTEVKIASGELFHGGTPIMNWAVGNAKVEPRGNAIMITKQISGSGKIDPLMSLFDAVALMSKNPEPPKPAPKYQMIIY